MKSRQRGSRDRSEVRKGKNGEENVKKCINVKGPREKSRWKEKKRVKKLFVS
jgi:hypothetical protein